MKRFYHFGARRTFAWNGARRAAQTIGLCFFLLPGLCSGADRSSQEKSILWSVRSQTHEIYLLGSIHYLRKDHYPLSASIEHAFDNATHLVFEIDLNTATPAATQKMTMERGVLRDGATLRQVIDEETYELTQQRARGLGIDMHAMDPLKPWLVALTLTAVQLQKHGFDPDYGVDRYLAGKAKRSGKTIGGLESLEFQLGVLDGMSRRDQEMMLRDALRELERVDQGVDRITQLWRRGDAGSLEELLLTGAREHPEVHEKIIVARNRRWLPKIEKMIMEGTAAMVVVGAAHLVGPDGVIELLKRRGYTVEQL